MPLKYANELSEKMFNWVFYFREEEEGGVWVETRGAQIRT